MAQILRQSTAVDVLIGPFVDLTLGTGAEVGESPSVSLSKNGQALAAKNDATTPVHDANGYYNCELDATDTNTVGTLVLIVAATATAREVRHEFQVIEEALYDGIYAAAAVRVPADTTAINGATSAAIRAEHYFTAMFRAASGSSWTTTTVADATNLTQSETDFWKGGILLVAQGTYEGLARLITAFDPATDTITFTPALPGAPAANDDYLIIPHAMVDLWGLLGTVMATPTTAGVPEVDVTFWRGTAVPAEHTAGYPIVTIKDGTGTGEINTNAGKVVGVELVDTLTTYTGNTVQTGDSFARLGAPAGASVSADIAVVDTVVDAVKAKTDNLTFTVANQVDANIESVNTYEVNGTGTPANPWGR